MYFFLCSYVCTVQPHRNQHGSTFDETLIYDLRFYDYLMAGWRFFMIRFQVSKTLPGTELRVGKKFEHLLENIVLSPI